MVVKKIRLLQTVPGERDLVSTQGKKASLDLGLLTKQLGSVEGHLISVLRVELQL